MSRRTTTRTVGTRVGVGLVIAASLLGAACSDDDDAADTTSGSAPATTSAATTPTTLGTTGGDTTAETTVDSTGDTSADTIAETTPETTPETRPETTAATPVTDDFDPEATVHVTYNFPPDTLDPHLEAGAGMRPYWRIAYDTLFEEDFYEGAQPGLVTDYAFSDDGLTFTATLRDDVQFADGTPLDAAAVKASLDRARGPEANPGVSGLLAAVTEVTVTDDDEFTISLSEYVPHLPGILIGPSGAIINPAALADPEALKSQTAGSGPYQSTSFVPQEQAEYERSEVPYWQPLGGRVAGITFTVVQDIQTNLNGLLSGEFDVFFAPGQIEQIEAAVGSDDAYVVHDFPAVAAETVFLSSTRGVLADERVRQALNYATDREGIAEGVYQGDCVATSQSFPEGNPLHVDAEPYSYDPDRARELIAEAAAEGETFEIVDQGNAVQVSLAAALQQQWSEIGLDVVQRTQPTSAFQMFAEGTLDTFVAALAKQAHPNLALIRYFLPNGPFHLGADNTELVELYSVLLDPTASEDAIAEAYSGIGELLPARAYVVPVCTPTNHLVAGSNIIIPETPYSGTVDYRWIAVTPD